MARQYFKLRQRADGRQVITGTASNIIQWVIAISIALSMGAFFLAENGRVNAFPTYVLAIAVIASLALPKTRRVLANHIDAVFVLAILLLVYLGISAGWSAEGDKQQLLKHLGYACLITSFILGLIQAHHRFPRFLTALIALVLAAATTSALISVYLHHALPDYQPLPEPRLYGLGRLSNPVISATSYGFALVLATALGLQQPRSISRNIVLGLACTALIYAIALTGSRTAWAGMGVAVGLGIASTQKNKPTLYFVTTVVVTGIAAVALIGPEEITRRAFSFRPEIWQEFIQRTLAVNPLFGTGSGSDSSWPTDILTFKHPHSIFVSTFYFGGAMGLGLLVTLLIVSIRKIRQSGDSLARCTAMMTLGYGITVGLLDGDNILTPVDYLWWVVWFPIAVTVTCDRPTA